MSNKQKNKKQILYGPEYKRTCTKCKVEKIIFGNFNKHIRQPFGIAIWCKECANSCDRKRRQANIEKYRELEKKWQKENKIWVNAYKREWTNRKNNKNTKANSAARTKLQRLIKSNIKNNIFLDYTAEELKKHIESQFTKGMTWDNYGFYGWHVDHIIPLSLFKHNGNTDHPAFKACWALSNLRPLWSTKEIAIKYGEDKNYIGNLEKSNKIEITQDIKEYIDRANNG